MACIQCTSANHQPSWEQPKTRAERQLIVWGRLKPQRCIVWAGDKSWCCHSDAELNPSSFLKGLICAEWAATPQRERTCLGAAVLGTFAAGASWGGDVECEGWHLSWPGGWAPLRSREPRGGPQKSHPRQGPGPRVSKRQETSRGESAGPLEPEKGVT